MLLIPLWQNLHFYLVHRAIHWPPLYRLVHQTHHKNVNPGPWSGLSMHSGKHLLYFSVPLLFLLVPSHPLHLVLAMVLTSFSPAKGHSGFEKLVVGGRLVDAGQWAHYLHHKRFKCNYADGFIPLGKWFGTFVDGSEQSLKDFHQRRRENKARDR